MEKNKGGRPPYQPTQRDRDTVEILAGFGIPEPDIASVLKISRTTMRKHFFEELGRGSAVVHAKLVGNLLRLSNRDDGTALNAIKFALSCRFNWKQAAHQPQEYQSKKEELNRKAANPPEGWGELLQ